MTYERLTLMLCDLYFVDPYLPPLVGKYTKEYKEACYVRWAVEELLGFILAKIYPLKTASLDELCEYVTEFADRMYQYSSKNGQTEFIFATASDTAADILDVLEAMKGEKK